MSRRSSNTVKLSRRASLHSLDKNGIPVLDDPRRANRLPRRCAPGMHRFVHVGRRFVAYDDDGYTYEIEERCTHCAAKSVRTEVE